MTDHVGPVGKAEYREVPSDPQRWTAELVAKRCACGAQIARDKERCDTCEQSGSRVTITSKLGARKAEADRAAEERRTLVEYARKAERAEVLREVEAMGIEMASHEQETFRSCGFEADDDRSDISQTWRDAKQMVQDLLVKLRGGR